MLKWLFIAFLLFTASSVSAQSLNQGKDFYYYQRYISAEDFFHQVISIDRANGAAWFWLIKTYFKEDKATNAMDTFSLARLSGDNAYGWVVRGMICLNGNHSDSAKFYFDKAKHFGKRNEPEIVKAVAEAYILVEKANAESAIELLKEIEKKQRNDADFFMKLGDAYKKARNGSEAFKAYQRASETDPQMAAAYYQMGKLFLGQQNTNVYLEYFEKAIETDPSFGPAYFELYRYFMYRDVARAKGYFDTYLKYTDYSADNEYYLTDLLYLGKEYRTAIAQAKRILHKRGESTKSRLFKLLGYSYAETGDTAIAIANMQIYLSFNDTSLIATDFEKMGELYAFSNGNHDSSISYYAKAVNLAANEKDRYRYSKKLALLSKEIKDYPSYTFWLGKFYEGNASATNVDLFNWGLAAYRASQFNLADSVFSIYTTKYPDQGFGYYWRARVNAAIDTALELGLAIPHYTTLIEKVGSDTSNATTRKWMIEAYSYLAAYETNTRKNYEVAIEYLGKVLEIDPENGQAKRYITILEKSAEADENSQ